MSTHEGAAPDAPDPQIAVPAVPPDQHERGGLADYFEEATHAAEERAFLLVHIALDTVFVLAVLGIDLLFNWAADRWMKHEKDLWWAQAVLWGLVVTTLVPTFNMLLRDVIEVMRRTWGPDWKRLRQRRHGGRERS